VTASPARAAPRAARPRTGTRTQTDQSTQTRTAQPWNVVVWDDPVNLMTYVVYVFQRLFGWDEQTATKHMLEVHTEGRSVVQSVDRERAEYFVTRLHGYGLQATLERPDAAG
jgi:ATP-dependent Clp protease adaptor protein ClpS